MQKITEIISILNLTQKGRKMKALTNLTRKTFKRKMYPGTFLLYNKIVKILLEMSKGKKSNKNYETNLKGYLNIKNWFICLFKFINKI